VSGETDIRAAADELGASVVVLGSGDAGAAAVETFGALDGPERSVAATAVVVEDDSEPSARPADQAGSDERADPADADDSGPGSRAGPAVTDAVAAALSKATAAFVATELGDPAATALLRSADATGGLTVALVALPPDLRTDEWDALAELRETADSVLLVPVTRDEESADRLLAAVTDLLDLVGTAGLVNLDLADLTTVLAAADLAMSGSGTGPREEGATAAVEAAVGPQTRLGVRHAPTVSVNVAGGEEMSVDLAGSAIEAVRDRVADDAHVIWGATVDDALDGHLRVDLVVGGVYLVPQAGDACPRCGATLADYALGDRSTVACEDCGFANLATRLDGRG
jgi:cell division protein FtsZ